MTPPAPPRWIGEREVSALTGLALPTLRNARSLRKGIPYAKVGSAVRYSLDDVIRFMEDHRVEMREGLSKPNHPLRGGAR